MVLANPTILLVLLLQMSFEGIPIAKPIRPEPKKVPKGKAKPEEVPTSRCVCACVLVRMRVRVYVRVCVCLHMAY
jgi:hypothetical protein